MPPCAHRAFDHPSIAARRNLEGLALGALCPPIHEHDATEPFPPELLPRAGTTTVIVSNPPWGKHIGKADDGARIVRSVSEQFRGCFMCW